MTEGALAFRVAELERRVGKVEEVKPDVIAERVQILGDDVRSLKRALYAFMFGCVGSAVVFAFTVFALLGGSPS